MLNKIILSVLISSLFCTNIVFAKNAKHVTKEKDGQKYYLNRCSSCHGAGSRGGNLYSINEWERIFSKNGIELLELHEGEDDVQDVIEYIKSDSFKLENKNMLNFIQEFAYDSELIPTCY